MGTFNNSDVTDADVQMVFDQHLLSTHVQTDKIFGMLLPAQWMFAVFCAVAISPYAWAGDQSIVHAHVWAAVFLGGLITAFPVSMTYLLPGHLITRLSVASSQALYSALLIHLMGGRIEAHFGIFATIALLASYRDRLVFIPAVAITVIDHLVRGFLWPMSVFGVATVVPWRPFEHAIWLLSLTFGLSYLVKKSLAQLFDQSILQCSLKNQRDQFENRVLERTAELEETKRFQASVLNSIDAHICILDTNGKIVFVNQRWIDFCNSNGGVHSHAYLGENYIAICENATDECYESSRQIADAIRKIAANKLASFSSEYDCNSDQHVRSFHIRLNPVFHNGTTGVAVVHVDVSQLKAAQSRADALAKIVLESPNELFIIAGDSLNFIEANAGALANLGYTLEELRSMTPLDIKPKLNRNQFDQILDQVRNSNGKAVEFETLHKRKNGTQYSTNVHLHKAKYQGEDVFVAFVTDTTEKIQLENRLRQAQKLESMGQLAAGIAHEINTPMQCVFSNVEFLQNSFERVLSVTDRFIALLEENHVDWTNESEALQAIRKKFRYDYLRQQTPLALEEATDASKRVISIVRAMKVMSHPGTSHKTPTDINSLIEDAATITRNRWKYVAKMEFHFDPAMENIDLLPAEMSQVFINMMVNAADSIAEKLGSEPEELGTITVGTQRIGDLVRIEISDTGMGISENVRQKIFDPFFTTKDVGKGTGQGLSITYDAVVNKHGGAIDLQSTPGNGASFFITIPVHDPNAGTPIVADFDLACSTDSQQTV